MIHRQPNSRIRRLLTEVAEQGMPHERDLWPAIREQLETRVNRVQARPAAYSRVTRMTSEPVTTEARSPDHRIKTAPHTPTERRLGHNWARQGIELVAGTLALILVAALLIAVFRNGNEREPNSGNPIGSNPTSTVGQVLVSAYHPDGIGEQLRLVSVDGSGVIELTERIDNTLIGMGDWSPDGRRLVYLQMSDTTMMIVLDVVTGERRELLTIDNEDGLIMFPQWSPSGQEIAYIGLDGNAEQFDIYSIDIDGSPPRNLTNDAAEDGPAFAWSPDGSQMAFQTIHEGEVNIAVIGADGANRRNVSNLPGDEHVPTWSPDGSQIAFYTPPNGNADIYVVNADGTGLRNLTNSPGDEIYPVWSPDGGKIVFTCTEEENEQERIEHLCLMNADGSNPHVLVPMDGYTAIHPDWSPNGQQIAFTIRPADRRPPTQPDRDDRSLFIINSDGTGLRLLVDHVSGEPAWRPGLSTTDSQQAQPSPATTSTTMADGTSQVTSELKVTFNFGDVSLSIDHPSEWRANPDQRMIASPDGEAALVVQAAIPTEEGLEAWARQRWGDASVTLLTNLELGGVPNIVFIADATAVPDTQQEATISLNLFAQPSEWVYEVTCVTRSPEAFERWQQVCDSMIRSVRFPSSEQ